MQKENSEPAALKVSNRKRRRRLTTVDAKNRGRWYLGNWATKVTEHGDTENYMGWRATISDSKARQKYDTGEIEKKRHP